MNLAREVALQVDFAAAMIALIALSFSVWAAVRQRRLENETLRLARDNDVLSWGNGVIDTLARLEALSQFSSDAELRASFDQQKIDHMASLSAEIDKGRMYFPNIQRDTHGTDKDYGYRGYRRPILDALVDAYDHAAKYRFGNAAAMAEVSTGINLQRRRFVSELQASVDPDRRLLFLARQAGDRSVDQVETVGPNMRRVS